MTKLNSRWREDWQRPSFRRSLAVTVPLLVLTLIALTRFLNWVEARPGVRFPDPILALYTPIDCTWVAFLLIYSGILIGIGFLAWNPDELLLALQTYLIMVAFRIVAMFLLPLDPRAADSTAGSVCPVPRDRKTPDEGSFLFRAHVDALPAVSHSTRCTAQVHLPRLHCWCRHQRAVTARPLQRGCFRSALLCVRGVQNGTRHRPKIPRYRSAGCLNRRPLEKGMAWTGSMIPRAGSHS